MDAIVVDGLGIAGAAAVEWMDMLVLLGVLGIFGVLYLANRDKASKAYLRK